jgi:putative endonuclease
MHFVYIIYSKRIDGFYVGETPGVSERLNFHNDPEKNTNSTKKGIPWELYWQLEVEDRKLARKIEGHIKRMKSRKYYGSLKLHSEIGQKLISKYKSNDHGVPGSPR